jgi:chromosome segregation ATPase
LFILLFTFFFSLIYPLFLHDQYTSPYFHYISLLLSSHQTPTKQQPQSTPTKRSTTTTSQSTAKQFTPNRPTNLKSKYQQPLPEDETEFNTDDFDNGSENDEHSPENRTNRQNHQYSPNSDDDTNPEEELDEFDDGILGFGSSTPKKITKPTITRHVPAQGRTSVAARPTLSTAPRLTSSARPTISAGGRTGRQTDQEGDFGEGVYESEDVKRERLEIEKYFNNKSLLQTLLSQHRQLQTQCEKFKLEKQSLEQSLLNKDNTLSQQLIVFEKSQSAHSKELQTNQDKILALQNSEEQNKEIISQQEHSIKVLESKLALSLEQSRPTTRRSTAMAKKLNDDLNAEFGDKKVLSTAEYQTLQDKLTSSSTEIAALKNQLQTVQSSYAELVSKGNSENKNESSSLMLEKYQTLLSKNRELTTQLAKYHAAFGEPDKNGNLPNAAPASGKGKKKAPVSTRPPTRHTKTFVESDSDDDIDLDESIDVKEYIHTKQMLTTKETEIVALKKEIDLTKADLTKQSDRAKRLDNENQQLNDELDDMEAELNEKNSELKKVNEQFQNLNMVHSSTCKTTMEEYSILKDAKTRLEQDLISAEGRHEFVVELNQKIENELNLLKEKIKESENIKNQFHTIKIERDNLKLQFDNIEDQIIQLRQENSTLQVDLNHFSNIESELQSKIDSMEEEYKDNEETLKRTNNNLNKQITNLNEQILKLGEENELFFAETNKNLQKKIDELTNQLSTERSDYQRFHTDADLLQQQLQTDLDNVQDELREVKRRLKTLQNSYQTLKDQNSNEQNKQEEIDIVIQKYENEKEQLIKSHKDEVNIINKEFNMKYELLNTNYQELQDSFDENCDKYNNLKATYTINYEKTLQELNLVQKCYDEKSHEYDSLILRYTELERDAELVRGEKDLVEKQRKQYLGSVNETQRNIGKQQQQIELLQGEIVKLEELVGDYKSQLDVANEEMVSANEFVQELEAKFAKSKTILSALNKKYTALKEEYSLLQIKYTSIKQDNTDLQQQVSQLANIKGSVGNTGGVGLGKKDVNFGAPNGQNALNSTQSLGHQPTVPQSVIKQRRQEQRDQFNGINPNTTTTTTRLQQQQQQQQQQPQFDDDIMMTTSTISAVRSQQTQNIGLGTTGAFPAQNHADMNNDSISDGPNTTKRVSTRQQQVRLTSRMKFDE